MRRAIVVVLLLFALLAPTSAGAAQHLEYTVLTPAGYASGERAYPVVYVVPGSGSTSAAAADTMGLQSFAARDEAIIVVAAEVGDGLSNFIVDWFDGSKPLDRSFTQELIPEVDAHYRTIADGAHRAIAGYSAGGYSSMALASRHPGLFASAGSFSGVTDLLWLGPVGKVAFEGVNAFFYGHQTLFRRWGNPLTDGANWRAQNPASLAGRLRGKRGIYTSAGNGVPGSVAEARGAGAALPQEMATESVAWQMTRSYDDKLTAAGVAHVYRRHFGIHTASNWREDLSRWWPLAIAAMSG
jgi:S-formylglutathione hydrolase FrmB